MTDADAVATLNKLLRGEISAVETYKQALAKVDDSWDSADLRSIHDEHAATVELLAQQVRRNGGDPVTTSGAWGVFAKTIEGAAKLFGNSAAIAALKEGEKQGIADYEASLSDNDLDVDSRALIEGRLLPQTRQHVVVLDKLPS